MNHNLAPVVSLSFGACEAAMGAAGNQFWNSLWQQAAAQGMTVLVSSGDSGAAGCDSPTSGTATHAAGVNGLCSTPYSICVGGTQFSDTSNPTAYWSASNASNLASALGYIPEAAWNSSGPGAGLWAGGGGASQMYTKPSWQSGPGVPADGHRDVPDVSLNSSTHDGYLVALNGKFYVFGGTSAAAPSLAGIMSLVVQRSGAPLGNANPGLYALATKQANAGAAVFHDTTSGNNSVPGTTGFAAGAGFDLATGLGSVDAFQLVNHWSDSTVPTPALQITGASSVSVAPGSSSSVAVSVAVSGGFSAPVAFSTGALPSGLTAGFTPASLAAPGAGTTTLKLSAAAGIAPGSYNVIVNASGGGLSKSMPLTVSIVGTCSYSLGATSASVAATAGNYSLSITTQTGCTWSASSTTSWISITSGKSGSGSATLSYSVASNTSGSARTGTLIIAGITFTVSQAGQASCSYSISLSPARSTRNGVTGSVSVKTSAGCHWNAVSNTSWISITSGASVTGSGTATYLADPNPGSISRSGTMSVAGYTITLTESGSR